MSVISDIVAQIRTAVFGRDVRESIAQGIQICYDDVWTSSTLATAAASTANTAAATANTAATAANTAAANASVDIERINLNTEKYVTYWENNDDIPASGVYPSAERNGMRVTINSEGDPLTGNTYYVFNGTMSRKTSASAITSATHTAMFEADHYYRLIVRLISGSIELGENGACLFRVRNESNSDIVVVDSVNGIEYNNQYDFRWRSSDGLGILFVFMKPGFTANNAVFDIIIQDVTDIDSVKDENSRRYIDDEGLESYINDAHGTRTGIWKYGYYRTVAVGSLSEYVFNKDFATTIIPVTEGDICTFNGNGTGGVQRLYEFVDSSFNVVYQCDTNLTNKRIVYAPENAAYFIVNNRLTQLPVGYFAYIGNQCNNDDIDGCNSIVGELCNLVDYDYSHPYNVPEISGTSVSYRKIGVKRNGMKIILNSAQGSYSSGYTRFKLNGDFAIGTSNATVDSWTTGGILLKANHKYKITMKYVSGTVTHSSNDFPFIHIISPGTHSNTDYDSTLADGYTRIKTFTPTQDGYYHIMIGIYSNTYMTDLTYLVYLQDMSNLCATETDLTGFDYTVDNAVRSIKTRLVLINNGVQIGTTYPTIDAFVTFLNSKGISLSNFMYKHCIVYDSNNDNAYLAFMDNSYGEYVFRYLNGTSLNTISSNNFSSWLIQANFVWISNE